jgi:hypothetical protein
MLKAMRATPHVVAGSCNVNPGVTTVRRVATTASPIV